jgi:multisubunit Na+/H+ antiporter MnhB subunit
MPDEEESQKKRIDRELIELLNELRVALPGVQVLFAFLLTLPFTPGWDKINGTDKNVYFTAVVLTALSIALLIAPTAHHRMRFRDHVKEQLLRVTSKLAIAGLVLLVGAVSTTLYLITDVVYSSRPASFVAAGFGAGVMALWFLVPLLYRDS